jgi:hypothetical protein
MSAVRPGTGWSALHPSETSPTGAIEAAKSYRKERNTVPASPYFRSLLEKGGPWRLLQHDKRPAGRTLKEPT